MNKFTCDLIVKTINKIIQSCFFSCVACVCISINIDAPQFKATKPATLSSIVRRKGTRNLDNVKLDPTLDIIERFAKLEPDNHCFYAHNFYTIDFLLTYISKIRRELRIF